MSMRRPARQAQDQRWEGEGESQSLLRDTAPVVPTGESNEGRVYARRISSGFRKAPDLHSHNLRISPDFYLESVGKGPIRSMEFNRRARQCLTEMEYHLFMTLWQWPRQRTRCHSLRNRSVSLGKLWMHRLQAIGSLKQRSSITPTLTVKPRQGSTTRR